MSERASEDARHWPERERAPVGPRLDLTVWYERGHYWVQVAAKNERGEAHGGGLVCHPTLAGALDVPHLNAVFGYGLRDDRTSVDAALQGSEAQTA